MWERAFGDPPTAALAVASRLYLRRPRTGDYEQWAALRNQSRGFLTPWEPSWPRDALTRDSFRRRIRRAAQEWREETGYGFFLVRRTDDALLGGITLGSVRRGVAQTATLGYWLGAPHARQGLMTEGVECALDFAFDRLGLHRVEAACLPNNIASRGLLKKCGFREEGLAREYLKINGRWTDHVLFGILATDSRPRG
ncbi:MAG: GNAT family N-acetyltransferase [Alphaproteobacteria bacterium]|nr:GNAT family N-acetyltransferase [Alphaproteobacteria bacterium]